MELVDIVPEFNLYEEFWKIYTKTDAIPPQYIDEAAKVSKCIIGEGTEIYGTVENSVIGSCVTIGEGAVVKDSIIMNGIVLHLKIWNIIMICNSEKQIFIGIYQKGHII